MSNHVNERKKNTCGRTLKFASKVLQQKLIIKKTHKNFTAIT